MAAHIPEDKPASNWPTITEQQWYTLAIIAVIFTTVIAFFASIWVFSATNISDQAARVAVIAPFGTIPIAIITFCTVAWRGMVTSRQADQQRRQNDAADDANYAKLLQEGAKLLADDKTTNRMAGVASLSILLNEPKARYRAEAMDVLAESVRALFNDEMSDEKLLAIRASSFFQNVNTQMRRQAEAGVFSNLTIVHKVNNAASKEQILWPSVHGFKTCTFEGGIILGEAEEIIDTNQRTYFKNTIIRRSQIKLSKFRFSNCQIENCDIIEIENIALMLNRNILIDCNFSGTKFLAPFVPQNLTRKNCRGGWYDIRNPPSAAQEYEWSQKFSPQIYVDGGWTPLRRLTGHEVFLDDEDVSIVREFHGI